MFPIFAVGNIITASAATVVTVVIFKRLFSAQRPHNIRAALSGGDIDAEAGRPDKKDPLLKDFAVSFAFLTIYFWLLGMPGVIVHGQAGAAVTVRLSIFFVLLAAGSFLAVPLRVIGKEGFVGRFLILSVVLYASAILILDFIFFDLSERREMGELLVYVTNQKAVLRLLGGAVAMLIALFGGIFFFAYGRRISDPAYRMIKIRAYLLGAGLLILTAAAILNFFIATFYPEISVFIASTIAGFSGIILMAVGILFIRPPHISY